MITYSVKKNKKTRMTFRLFGLFLMAFTLLLIVPAVLGYDKHSTFSLIIAFLFGLYGLTLVIHSFGKTQYDNLRISRGRDTGKASQRRKLLPI